MLLLSKEDERSFEKKVTKKMSLSLLNSFSKDIEVIIDDENKPWFKRAHVGKCLGLADVDTSTRKLDGCEKRLRIMLRQGVHTWSGPKDQQNKTDIFLSFYGDQHCFVKSFFTKASATAVQRR